MPQTARRNAIGVFTLLIIVLSFTARYFFLKLSSLSSPVAGFQARCGQSAMIWWLTVSSVTSFAFLLSAFPLFYQIYKRGKGHALNGITASYAIERLFLSFAFAVPFLNLQFAPCWMPPSFYSLVLASVAVVMLHTWRRTPDLIHVPDFEMTGFVNINRIIGKADRQESVEPDELQLFKDWAEDRASRLERYVIRPDEGSQ